MGPVVDAALTAVMVATPTVLYVGFWRLLMKLRDDDLINRLDREMNLTDSPDRSGRRPPSESPPSTPRTSTPNSTVPSLDG